MKKNTVRKGIVFGIIVLFVGASVVPVISENVEQVKNNEVKKSERISVLYSNLIGYWSFDDESDPGHDDSGNGNYGTVNGATWITNGVINGALSFDGINDDVVIGNVNPFLLITWTIAGWIYIKGYPPSITTIVGKDDDENNKYNFNVALHDNSSILASYETCGDEFGHPVYSDPVPSNTWVFFTSVRDSNTGEHKIYINAVEHDSGIWAENPCTNYEHVRFAHKTSPQGPQSYFNGYLDEIRIYNRALNDEEIQEIYGGNLPPVADFTWSPLEPNPGETVTFDASDSYDPDGTITSYEWDFDNDGQYDDGAGEYPTWQWPNAGNYPVSLKATDNDGATDTQTKTVNVGGGNQGDLAIIDIMPIQVIENCNTLVQAKKTVVKVNVHSTFNTEVYPEVYPEFKIIYDKGNSYAYEKGPSGSGVEIKQGDNWIYLPGGPGGPSSTLKLPWDFGNELIWWSTGTDNQFSVEVDWNNKYSETNEQNNKKTHGPLTIINTRSPYKIRYQSWKLPPDCDDDPGVSYKECQRTGDKNSYFISGSFPIPSYDPLYAVSQYPRSHSCSIKEDMVQLAEDKFKDGFHRVVGIVSSEYFKYHKDELGGKKTGLSWYSDIEHAVLIEEGYWKTAAHEIHHTYDGWRTGYFEGGGEEYNTHEPARDAFGFWVDKHYEIDWKAPSYWNQSGVCFMGEGTYESYRYEIQQGEWWKDVWVCDSCYEHLLDELKVNNQKERENGKAIFVSGTINKSGWMEFNNMYVIEDREFNNLTSGDYSIQMFDEFDQVIYEIDFNINFLIVVDLIGGIEVNTTCFAFSLPYPDSRDGELAKIQMKHNDTLLAERIVSPNSPNVEVLYPNGGEQIDVGSPINVTWSGSDLDGDSLNYTVLISSDNGVSWMTMSNEIIETQFVLETDCRPPGDMYKIRVMATDGVNTYYDDSDETFALINLLPDKPTINGPTSGKPGIDYEYTLVSTDPEGTELYYFIDWGDRQIEEWIGPHASGQSIIGNHIWDEEGDYTIRVKALDKHFLESNWSDPLVINIEYSNPFLLGLIYDVNESEMFSTFNANLLLWLSFSPFSFKFYHSGEKIIISNEYRGVIFEPFIFGRFSAAALLDTQTSFSSPLLDRFRRFLPPNPSDK